MTAALLVRASAAARDRYFLMLVSLHGVAEFVSGNGETIRYLAVACARAEKASQRWHRLSAAGRLRLDREIRVRRMAA